MRNTRSLKEFTIEVLQEEYCYVYYQRYNKLPKPSLMSKTRLISQINKMRSFIYSEQDAIANYNRSSAHLG